MPATTFEGRLLLNSSLIPGQVTIEQGRITRVVTDTTAFSKATMKLPDDSILSPGFVDIQVNGAFGKEFKTDTDAVSHVSARLPEFGTTSFCATVTTRGADTYAAHLSQLATDSAGATGAHFLGFHLEGPALNAEKVGAQAADLLVAPENLTLNGYLNDAVKIVTFAPELAGAAPFIETLKERGIRVGVGHSTISYDDLVAVFDPTNMMIVHAYNAMSDLNSRRPGVIGAALDRDDFYASVIADRIHVSDPSLRIFWKSKTDKSKVIAITDGAAVTGLPVGLHQIGARSIEKRADRAVLEGTETLVGSTLTLDAAARNLCAVTQCSAAEALDCVTRNPATFLGLEHEIGVLAEGARGDVVELDADLSVQRTFLGGELAWSR